MRKFIGGRGRYFIYALFLVLLVTFDVIQSKASSALGQSVAPEQYFFDSFDPEIDGYTEASLVRHVAVVRSDYDSLSSPKPRDATLDTEDIRNMVFKAISLDKQYPGNTSVLKALVNGKGSAPRVSVMANINAYPGFRYTTGDQTDPRVIKAVLEYLADSTNAVRISLLLGGSYQTYSAETDIFVNSSFNGIRWNQFYSDLPDNFSLQGMISEIQSRHPTKIIEGINSNYDEVLDGGRSYRDLTPTERVGRMPEFYPVPVGGNGIGALSTTNTESDNDSYNPTEAMINCDLLVNIPVMKIGPYEVNVNGIFKNYVGTVSRASYSSVSGTYPMDRSKSLTRLDHNYLVGTIINLFSYKPTDYTVFDALFSLEGEGSHPYTNATGLVQRNLILAGKDPVSVEAVGAATMKINPLDIEHLRWAHAKGYGVMDLRRIVIDGMAVSAVDTDMVAAIDGQGLRNYPGFANRHYTGRTCRRWLLNGSYKSGTNRETHIDEAGANPLEGDTVNGNEWSAHYTPTPYVDLSVPFSAATDSTVVYAFTRLFSDSARSGVLYAGGGRDIRIWINGVLVADTSLLMYNDASVYKNVTLAAGDNRILVKVRKSGTNFRFSLAVVNSGLESSRNSARLHSSSTSLGSGTTLNAEKKMAFFGGRTLFGTFYHLGSGNPYDIGIEKSVDINDAALLSVHPNPFNPVTTVAFKLLDNGVDKVSVDVYDISGRHVAKLYSGNASNFEQRVYWNGTNYKTGKRVAAGQYVCRLTTRHGMYSRKVVFLP